MEKDMKIGDIVKTKGKPWHPLDTWTIEDIFGNRAYLGRREGCGIAVTAKNIDELEVL